MDFSNLIYETNPITCGDKADDRREDFFYGMYSMQGYRRHQEDQSMYKPCLYKDFSYFAVFDGHNGIEVAAYLKNNFHKILLTFLETEQPINALHLAFIKADMHLRTFAGLSELKSFKSGLEPSDDENLNPAEDVVKNILDALGFESDDSDEADPSNRCDEDMCSRKTFDDFVKRILEVKPEIEDSEDGGSDDSSSEKNKDSDDSETEEDEERDSVKTEENPEVKVDLTEVEAGCSESIIDHDKPASQKEEKMEPGIFSGSTATVVLFSLKTIYVANVGDSRCIISTNKNACEISEDHEPTLKQERIRIIKSGHEIKNGRINGILNLSRSIGDFFLKRQALPLHQQAVIPVPYIKEIKCDNTLDFLVVASDGIWGLLKNEDVVDFIVKSFNEQQAPSLSGICEELGHHCIHNRDMETGDGMDNITTIIVVPSTSSFFQKIPKVTHGLEELKADNSAKKLKKEGIEEDKST